MCTMLYGKGTYICNTYTDSQFAVTNFNIHGVTCTAGLSANSVTNLKQEHRNSNGNSMRFTMFLQLVSASLVAVCCHTQVTLKQKSTKPSKYNHIYLTVKRFLK